MTKSQGWEKLLFLIESSAWYLEFWEKLTKMLFLVEKIHGARE